MEYHEFKDKCEKLTSNFDKSIGRKYNRDAIGHWVRAASIPFVYFCYKVGIKAQWVLYSHFVSDGVALYFVYKEKPLLALCFWLFAHFVDNIDGQVARIRNEAHPKWGELDIHLHLIAILAFWIIIGYQIRELAVCVLLAARVLCEAHRGKKSYGERYGERSWKWKLAALPTDVNFIYLSYVPFALFDLIKIFILAYCIYFVAISLGQSIVKISMTIKKT